MIEIEIRGRLTDSEYDRLFSLLKKDGEYLGRQEREMYLLYDYPGFSLDPTNRNTDIRLRCTNGNSEIMVKHKTHGENVGREEISLKINDPDLEKAKQVVKALGYGRGLKMNRTKELFRHGPVEWSLVKLPDEFSYYEAEIESPSNEHSKEIHEQLIDEAKRFGLSVMEPDEMRQFIEQLDEKFNKEVKF